MEFEKVLFSLWDFNYFDRSHDVTSRMPDRLPCPTMQGVPAASIAARVNCHLCKHCALLKSRDAPLYYTVVYALTFQNIALAVMSHTIDRKLPEEILDHVVSLCDRNALPKLCLTSKTFHRLAFPRLYSTIHVRNTAILRALALLVFRSPEHAALVKHLVVPDISHDRDEREADESHECLWPDNPGLKLTLQTRCLEVTSSDDEADELYKKIEKGINQDAVLVLLLANLPALRKLDISFGCGERHKDFHTHWLAIINHLRLSSHASAATTTKKPRSMPLLVPIDIMAKGEHEKYPNDPAHIVTFMHMPNLRSLYGWKFGNEDEDDPNPAKNPYERLKAHSCPVENIELRESKLHKHNYKLLLAATVPGNLKTFIYEIGCTWAWVTIDHPAIMQGLLPHRHTLESLCLSYENVYPFQFGSDDTEKPYPCSFTPFTGLKRLKVTPCHIWGHDGLTDSAELNRPEMKQMLWQALPENLEELWITRAEHQQADRQESAMDFVPKCLIPALEIAIRKKRESFAKLKELRIDLPPFVWENGWLESLASVCELASQHEIRTAIIFYEMCEHYGQLTSERLWGWNEDVWWEPTRYSTNRESQKIWIDGGTPSLAQRLIYLKDRFAEENDVYEKHKHRGGRRREREDAGKRNREAIIARYHDNVAELLAEYCSKKMILGKAQ